MKTKVYIRGLFEYFEPGMMGQNENFVLQNGSSIVESQL
jgi:hypothetical protein